MFPDSWYDHYPNIGQKSLKIAPVMGMVLGGVLAFFAVIVLAASLVNANGCHYRGNQYGTYAHFRWVEGACYLRLANGRMVTDNRYELITLGQKVQVTR